MTAPADQIRGILAPHLRETKSSDELDDITGQVMTVLTTVLFDGAQMVWERAIPSWVPKSLHRLPTQLGLDLGLLIRPNEPDADTS